jgi:hypothetical protein
MARARAKKSDPNPTQAVKPEPPKVPDPLSPEKVHQLFGLVGPYDPPPPPVPQVGYATFWDPGLSVHRLRESYRRLFYPSDFPGTARFARDTDSWRWRQLRLTPTEPGLTFPDQAKQLANGDKPAAARELVTFLVLHFLATGERFELDRWRCADVLPSGLRVCVGPFSHLGLDLGSVSDGRTSPGVALSVSFTPPRPK